MIPESHRGMKGKIIKALLAKKFNSFAASIEDEAVRKLVEKNTIITGGCIASMLLGEKINDFDLYFTDHATTKAVAEYYVKRFEVKNRHGIPCAILVDDQEGRVRIVVKSAGVASAEGADAEYQYFEGQPEGEAAGYVGEVMGDPGEIEETYQETEALALETTDATYRPVFMSTNAITLSDKVQIVLRFYGQADAIHENYDFVHCTNYWTSGDGNLVLRQSALESLLCRELRYVGSKYPVCSVIRLRKFIRRGWVINAGQILKMMMQTSELDLTDPAVLQDQLTGVDSAYFIELMSKVKEKDPTKVNSAYLVEIIDRMF
jgi:hypothetical protein